MPTHLPLWVIVLAGGEGRRLSDIARARYGYDRPKQFCDFGDGTTLLARTLRRAGALAPDPQIVVCTTRTHRVEADECLADFPGVHRVEQPIARDTTPGVALPLMYVLSRDPRARVVVMPSDHAVGEERVFTAAIANAVLGLHAHPGDVLLLGSPPDGDADGGVGWIVPAMFGSGRWPRVTAFVEKPPPSEARALADSGALVNTFVMVANAWTLAGMVLAHAPAWFGALRRGVEAPGTLEAAYGRLPPSNFSSDILAPAVKWLRVVPLPPVGWSDIGTPARLHAALGASASL